MTQPTRLLLGVVLLIAQATLPAQVTFPTAAPSDERSGLHAFTNATIYTDYKTSLDKATLVHHVTGEPVAEVSPPRNVYASTIAATSRRVARVASSSMRDAARRSCNFASPCCPCL